MPAQEKSCSISIATHIAQNKKRSVKDSASRLLIHYLPKIDAEKRVREVRAKETTAGILVHCRKFTFMAYSFLENEIP